MSNIQKAVAAVVGLLAMAIIVSRELFLFTNFKDSQGVLDSSGGSYSFWLALIAVVMACVAGGLMFYFLGRRDGIESPRASNTTAEPALAAAGQYANASVPAPAVFDAVSWAQLNPWLSEGQANDRRPMPATERESFGSLAARRSITRRNHQVMYKKWSQSRHD